MVTYSDILCICDIAEDVILFIISDKVTMDKTFNLLTFNSLASIFQGHRESLCFKINFIYTIFPVVLG